MGTLHIHHSNFLKPYFFLLLMIIFLLSCNNHNKIQNNKNIINRENNSINLNEEENTKQTIIDEDILYQKSIPKSLYDYINKNLSSYLIPELSDYIKGWEKFSYNNNLPFICMSDFNGDGLEDYAIILLKDGIEIHLFAFHTTAISSYRYYLIDSVGKLNQENEIILSIEKKGLWEAIDESINVENDGILIDFIRESKSWAYYWDGKKYIKFLFD